MAESDPKFALGAEDPEMRAIETLLNREGQEYYQAIDDVGNSVHCGVAYNAHLGPPPGFFERSGLIFIETYVPTHVDNAVGRFDHHHKDDAGFDKPVEQAVAASSLGQLANYLGVDLSDREKALAAIDHSPVDTLLGRVPDVDPNYALQVHLEEIASTHNMTVAEVEEVIPVANSMLIRGSHVEIGGEDIIDLSNVDLGAPNSLEKLTTQIAAILARKGILIQFWDYVNGGDLKLMLCGDVEPAAIEYFKETYAPEHNLERVYGVPSRHYAGGYLPKPA